MIDTTQDLFAYLSDVTNVTAAIDSYNGGPAIFDTLIPPDHEISLPVIIVDYPTFSDRLHTSSRIIRDIVIPVRIYAQTQFTRAGLTFNDTLPLQQASEAVADALITMRIPVTGGTLRGVFIDGPIIAPTENPSLSGRLITLRWNIEEDG